MLIFAADTSLESASVALIRDNHVLHELTVNNHKKHATTFMPMVEHCFSESVINVSEVDLFAISGGPGSFTGLRIGMSSMKTMAYALNKKMVVVPTLDILASQSKEENKIICPIINARNNQVYTAIYNTVKLTEDMAIPIEELAEILKKYDSEVVLSGDAASMHLELLTEKLKNKVTFNIENTFPKASVCGLIAFKYDKIEAKEALPFYVRSSQAERLFNK
ncbi:MAG: tRNA (adenosine(37)-N6)-threonylcarbamoyltransferase complex dimerization subunit type 1 TsaB [Clostridia bacterium]|nr:tRNA (adenosine(37)-N6)-threonylcarbamoyltransferase complex dimerization subunit type 1 TsaB [Clostridia bacterium]